MIGHNWWLVIIDEDDESSLTIQWCLNGFIGLGRCLPGFDLVLDHSTLCRFLLLWQVCTIFLKSCLNLKYTICLPHSHIKGILKCVWSFSFFQSKRDRFHCRACCLLSQQACSNKFRFSMNFKCWWVQQWSIFVSVSCRSLIFTTVFAIVALFYTWYWEPAGSRNCTFL